MLENDKQEREQYEQGLRDLTEAVVNLQEVQDRISDSTKSKSIKIEDTAAYIVNLADLHIPEGNIYALVESLRQLARIPNVRFVFDGDTINNSIKSSIGDTHKEVINGQQQIQILAQALRDLDKEVPILDKIVAFLIGNHEVRSEKDTSLSPIYMLAAELGLSHRYVKNILELNVELINDKNPKNTLNFTGEITHGTHDASQPGAQADAGLNGARNSGLDFVMKGHNHKPISATTKKEVYYPGRVTPEYEDITFGNVGASIPGGEYADGAGYPFPKILTGQVMRLSVVGGKKHIDFMTVKGMLDETQNKNIERLEKAYKVAEEKEYASEEEIIKTYRTLAKRLTSFFVKENKEHLKKVEKDEKKSKTPRNVYFVPLSGFMIGSGMKNLKEIKKAVDVLKTLDCKIVLNGDMLFYKKAVVLGQLGKGQRYTEDTYQFMKQLAEILQPVADKIIGINYGTQEDKIMSFQDQDLAKKALINSQMDESLVYEPYNKKNSEIYQRKVQERQVTQFNKSNLRDAYRKFDIDIKPLDEKLLKLLAKTGDFADLDSKYEEDLLKITTDFEGLIEDLGNRELEAEDKKEKAKIKDELKEVKADFRARKKELKEDLQDDKCEVVNKIIQKYEEYQDDDEFVVELEIAKGKKDREADAPKSKSDKQKELIEEYLVKKLRKEGKLLNSSSKKDKARINKLFPLGDINVRIPQKDLLANMLCHFMGTDVKNVKVAQKGENVINYVKVKDQNNKTRTISIYGGTSNSKAQRAAMFRRLSAMKKNTPNLNVYYTNGVLGNEFCVLDVSTGNNRKNKKVKQIIDTVLISGGTFANEFSKNKIYRIYATAAENENVESSGVYKNMESEFNMFCDSINYETVHLNPDVTGSIINNMAKRSFLKTLKWFRAKKEEAYINVALESFEEGRQSQSTTNKNVNKKEVTAEAS